MGRSGTPLTFFLNPPFSSAFFLAFGTSVLPREASVPLFSMLQEAFMILFHLREEASSALIYVFARMHIVLSSL